MSFIYDPSNQDGSSTYTNAPLQVSNIHYFKRAAWFTGVSIVISLVGIFAFIFPLAFAFSYLSVRNYQQALKEGASYRHSKILNILSYLPFVILTGFTIYASYLVSEDSSGWAVFGLMIMVVLMIPAIIAAGLIGFFTTKYLRKKDHYAAADEPRSLMIFVYRIMGYFAVLASSAVGVIWCIGMLSGSSF